MLSDRYEVVLADTEDARKIHYQMRYQVYCLEQGWEPADGFPDGQEKDEFDSRAVHFLIRERAPNRWVGTLRVVLPDEAPLPIESLNVLTKSGPSQAGTAAEISRVCRPRSTLEAHSPELGGASEILLRLLRGAGEYCREQDIGHLYMFCRPAMVRLLGRLSIPITRAGIPTDHRGIRVPYLVDLDAAFSEARRGSPALARLLREPVAYRRASDLAAAAGRRWETARAACAA